MSGHCHHHHGAENLTDGRLRVAIGLTFVFVLAELISGLRAGSLALVSDAGHNFTDGLALALSWYAIKLARRPATGDKTFGYHRAGILAALLNSVTLLVISVFILREAILHLLHPEPVASGVMMAVAGVAIVLNLAIALGIRGEAAHSVNMRSAYIHMAGDALASLGVVIAGAVIHFTHWYYADPLISLGIAGMITWSSWGIITETVNVLLEGAPRGMDLNKMARDITAVAGVDDVHDLHVWTIADHLNALSCHLHICKAEAGQAAGIVRDVKAMLAADYDVRHSTIETECRGCTDKELYCSMSGHQHEAASHSH